MGGRRSGCTAHPGDRIRLRLLNSANGRIFKPDFGGLDVRIIAVDGLYLREAIPYRGFELAPGNRLDLDIRFGAAVSGMQPVVDRFYEQQANRLGDIVVDGIGASDRATDDLSRPPPTATSPPGEKGWPSP